MDTEWMRCSECGETIPVPVFDDEECSQCGAFVTIADAPSPEAGDDTEPDPVRWTVAEVVRMAGTQVAVARACGVSVRAVAGWRSGRTAKVPFDAVKTCARLAKVRLDEIG